MKALNLVITAIIISYKGRKLGENTGVTNDK